LNQLWFPMVFLQSRSETLSQSGRVQRAVSRWLWFCLWSLRVTLVPQLRLVKQFSPHLRPVKQSLQGKQLPSGNRSHEARWFLLGKRLPSERRSHEAKPLLLVTQFPWEGTSRPVKPGLSGSRHP